MYVSRYIGGDLMDYIQEYNDLKSNASRIQLFKSSGEKDGTRIFTVLNSNIKALKTVGEYIETMYPVTKYDSALKQKTMRVKSFNFRSLDNHNDQRAITRSDLIIAAGRKFNGYDNAFVSLLLYILLLDTGNGQSEVVRNADLFIDSLPIFIKRRIYEFARNIAANNSFLTNNIYQQLVVLYGDKQLYEAFIEYIYEQYPDEKTITDLFDRESKVKNSPIVQRLDNFQRSALKKDGLYTVIYYALDQYVKTQKMRGVRTGNKIVDGKSFLFGFLDYFDDIFEGSFTWLGKMAPGEDMENLKDFIENDLTVDQSNEIVISIQNAFDLMLPVE